MAGLSDYLENALVNHTLRNSSLTSPTAVYVSLHTANPTDAGNGAEVSTVDTGYSRATVTTTGGTAFVAPTDGVTSNASAVNFASPSASWGLVTHFGIWDAASGGNMLFHAPLTPPEGKTINNGDSVSFAGGALTVTFA
jgi:hypothetical protein